MRYATLTGRCWNGAERDHGRVVHVVDDDQIFGPALCGAKPGKRSNGWSEYPHEKPTCPRCIKKLEKAEKQRNEQIAKLRRLTKANARS